MEPPTVKSNAVKSSTARPLTISTPKSPWAIENTVVDTFATPENSYPSVGESEMKVMYTASAQASK